MNNKEVASDPHVLIYFRERATEKEKVEELANFLEKKSAPPKK